MKIEGKAPNHDDVSYPGSAPAMPDLLGSNIESVFDPMTTNVATLKAGSLRALAVSTAKRLTALIPDVLARAGVAARLEDLHTLPRPSGVIGDEFVTLIRSQIDAWRAVARASNVEVTG